MGNFYKKAMFTIALGLGVNITAFSQTVHKNYVDGKIWVKVKSFTPKNYMTLKSTSDAKAVDAITMNEIPELATAFQQHTVSKISKPFAVAKNGSQFGLDKIVEVEFTDIHNVDAFVEQLANLSNVEYAEKVPLTRPNYAPNDADYNSTNQWNLFSVAAEAAWDFSFGDPNIVVAIVDDAIEMTHPDLNGSIWTNPGEIPNNNIDDDNNGYIDDVNGYDVASNDNDASPPNNQYDHGTIIAGLAGANTDNNIGMASIGFGISLMPVKSSSNPNVITNGYGGIVYAVNAGADIINISWGSYANTFTTEAIIEWVDALGPILVASAGDDDSSAAYYPAAYPEVIAVAGTDIGDAKTSISNYGTWVDICAPAQGIYSTEVGGTYNFYSGTSLGVPMVSGLLGLIWSANPFMPKQDVIDCLLNNADNIDSQNTSYIGMLGAGRINAENSVGCADATLLFPPDAMFTAYQEIGGNVNISNGSTVNFIDESTYNPTTWSWSFPGGTPSTSSLQNPSVDYNTPGTYNVTLTVLNNNGNDQEVKTGYVIVQQNDGCDTLHVDDMFAPNTNWPVTYCAGQCVNGDGYVSGTNALIDYVAVAEKYQNALYTYCWGTDFWFSNGNSDNLNDSLTFFITPALGNGEPNPVYASTVKRSMGQISSDVQNNLATQVYWDSPVDVTSFTNGFFIGVEFPSLKWGTSSDDSLSVVMVSHDSISGNFTGWSKTAAGAWGTYTGWTFLGTAHYIDALMADEPAELVYTPTSVAPICEGETVDFDATGSTYGDTLLWTFPGGTPTFSNNPAVTVSYNTAGTYKAYIEIIGGDCSVYMADSIDITVLPAPVLSITTTGDTICPNGSTSITASGANSYSWTPSTGLSCTNCANPVATPSSTTTYTLTGTGSNTCQSSTSITIYVEEDPVANFISSDDTVCVGDQVIFNGAVSTNATSYSWTFQSGTPATSSNIAEVVTWNTAGNFQVDLSVQNGCSQVDDTTWTITIQDAVAVNTTNSSTNICTGDTIYFDATTSTGEDTYSWDFTGGDISTSTSGTPIVVYNTAGTYTWEVTITGPCGTDTESGTVTVADNADANVTASSFTVCEDDTVYYDGTGSIGASTYSWTFTGGDISTSSIGTPKVVYATAGTYNWELEVNGNCGSDIETGTVQIDVCVGIEELVNNSNVNSFFSSANEKLNITFNSGVKEEVILSVMSSDGKLITSSRVIVQSDGQVEILDLNNLARGIYLLRVNGEQYDYLNKFSNF